MAWTDRYFSTLLDLCVKQVESPYNFDLYHKSIRTPFDYYQFGLDFAHPVINFKESKVVGVENLARIQEILAKGDNVVIFSNHQSEGDPHAIDTVLQRVADTKLGAEIIFVAVSNLPPTLPPQQPPLFLRSRGIRTSQYDARRQPPSIFQPHSSFGVQTIPSLCCDSYHHVSLPSLDPPISFPLHRRSHPIDFIPSL